MLSVKPVQNTYTKGKIESSKRNGLRKAIFAPKSKRLFKGYYKGEWKDDKKEGKGKELDRNGFVYYGNWFNNERHGYGDLSKISEDGITRQRYVGNWMDGKKQGFGCNWFVDGSYYEGEFWQNKRQGYGCIWYCNGEYYQGTWQNNLYHGEGMFVKANGNTYEGQFVQGKKEGYGVFFHIVTGQKQYGFWKEDFFIKGAMLDMYWRQSAPCPTPYPIPPVELAEKTNDSNIANESVNGNKTAELISDEHTCKRKSKRIISNICLQKLVSLCK